MEKVFFKTWGKAQWAACRTWKNNHIKWHQMSATCKGEMRAAKYLCRYVIKGANIPTPTPTPHNPHQQSTPQKQPWNSPLSLLSSSSPLPSLHLPLMLSPATKDVWRRAKAPPYVATRAMIKIATVVAFVKANPQLYARRDAATRKRTRLNKTCSFIILFFSSCTKVRT